MLRIYNKTSDILIESDKGRDDRRDGRGKA